MKKIISLLLVALLCLGTLTACGASSDYEWTNEQGLSFDVSKLNYAGFDIASIYDDNGQLKGIKGLDYVTLPEDYMSIVLKQDDVMVAEEDIDAAVEEMLNATAVPEKITEGTIEKGDMVNIDYVGTVDGVAFTGGNTQGMGTDVEAGSTAYIDDFLTQIIGHEPGETIDVVVTFPEGYNDSTDADGNTMVLAGKEAVFTTTINYIHGEAIVPELTDEWAAANLSMYGVTTVEDLRNVIAASYTQQNKYLAVQDYLLANATFAEELPEELYTFAAEYSLYVQNYYAMSLGGNLEQYLQMQKYDSVEAFLDAMAPTIQLDVKNYLITQALSEAMDVSMDSEAAAALLGSNYAQYVNTYGENYTNMVAISSKCISTLTDNATITK